MQYKVFTDGACSGNKRDANCPGGYGFAVTDIADNVLFKGGGGEDNTTNNRMEMTAVISGLHELKGYLGKDYSKTDIVVVTDSKYVCDNYEDYLPTWKKNGWRKSNGSQVLNVDLWKQIDEKLLEFKSFRFQWVKGHANNEVNNLVDSIAQEHSKRRGELL